jgi:predicted nucleic acid-binding protein
LFLRKSGGAIELKRRDDRKQAEALDRWFMQMRIGLADRVLSIDEPIAETWAFLNAVRPLPWVDSLLAATAKVHGLTLVTRDTAGTAGTGVPVLDPFAA